MAANSSGTSPPPYNEENNANSPSNPSASSSGNANSNASFPQLFVPVNGPITANEYSKIVADWQVAYNGWIQASCAHYGALLSGAVAAPLQAAYHLNSLNAALYQSGVAAPQPARVAIIRKATYSIPSIWKRVAAECIDTVMLFVLRLIVTIALLRNGFFKSTDGSGVSIDRVISIVANEFIGDDDEEDLRVRFGFTGSDSEGSSESFDSALEDLLSITSQFVVVECISLALYTIYEVISLLRRVGPRRVGGASIGKSLLGLKVIQHDISRLRAGERPNTVIVFNARTLVLWRAVVRSVVKNFSASVMFPASLTVFFYSHRLAVYDILAASTVVEAQSERDLSLEHVE